MDQENQQNEEVKLGNSEKKILGISKIFSDIFPHNKLFAFITVFISAGGLGSLAFLNNAVDEKIRESAKPAIRKEINIVLDSIRQSRENYVGLRSDLSRQMGVSKDSVHYIIGDWYKSEKMIYGIGVYIDLKTKRTMYNHVDGHSYRAIYDYSQSRYYFINDNGEAEWVR